jgi:hypothetical protein
MTTIEQLKQELVALQQKLETLEAAEKVKDWPHDGDEYWVVTDKDYLITYKDTPCHIAYKETGNCFRTREEAETELEVRKIIHKLRMSPGRVEKRFNNQWTVLINGNDTVYMDDMVNHTSGFLGIRWDSKESCQAAIDSVGAENIIKAAKWLARV